LNVNIAPATAPDVNVRVEAPAAPPATVVVKPGVSSRTTSSNTSVTSEKTTVPAPSSFDPALGLGIGLAVLLVLILSAVAMANGRKAKTTVTTVR